MRIRLLDGTGVVELKYTFEDVDRHGNVRIYVKKGRKAQKVRLREPIGSAAFLAEYQRAIRGETAPKPKLATISGKQGSFAWLIMAYKQSGEFRQLKDSTKRVRSRILDAICRKVGQEPCSEFGKRHIIALRDEKADLPAAANNRLKILKVLFKWGEEADLIEHNPALTVKRLKIKTDGFHRWTEAEVRQFEARHPEGSKARLALSLLLYTGTRRSDVVTLGRQMEQGASLRFKQTKTGGWLILPILPALREEIGRHPTEHLTYLVTEYGHSFSAAGFGNWFRDRCDEAGLTQCSAHGLRKAGATRAANQGASAHQLKALYGWADISEAETYTREADQVRLAESGIHYLERKEGK